MGISANELRIGNLVCVGENALHADGGGKNQIYEISELKTDVVQFRMFHAGEYYKDLKPIPLTEEWLLNFLFTKLDNLDTFELKDGNYRSIQIDLNSNGIEIYLCGTDSVMSSQCFPVDNVKYVHQLQNLFFALTGEELTLEKTQEG